MENRTPQLHLYSDKQGLIVREDTLSQINLTKYHFRTPAGTELQGLHCCPAEARGSVGVGHAATPASPSKPSHLCEPSPAGGKGSDLGVEVMTIRCPPISQAPTQWLKIRAGPAGPFPWALCTHSAVEAAKPSQGLSAAPHRCLQPECHVLSWAFDFSLVQLLCKTSPP